MLCSRYAGSKAPAGEDSGCRGGSPTMCRSSRPQYSSSSQKSCTHQGSTWQGAGSTWTQTPAARCSLLVRYRPSTASKLRGDLHGKITLKNMCVRESIRTDQLDRCGPVKEIFPHFQAVRCAELLKTAVSDAVSESSQSGGGVLVQGVPTDLRKST